ncbi:MAG: hypothetical protein AAB635_01665 [Patescibacteria group bacterium]
MKSDENDEQREPRTDDELVSEWTNQLGQFLSGGEGGVSLDRIVRDNNPSRDQIQMLIESAKSLVTVFDMLVGKFDKSTVNRIARTRTEIQKLNSGVHPGPEKAT